MLRQLRERHSGLLASGKSGQQASAQAADRACTALSGATIRQGRYNATANSFLMASFLAILLVFVSRQQIAQVGLQRLFMLASKMFLVAVVAQNEAEYCVSGYVCGVERFRIRQED